VLLTVILCLLIGILSGIFPAFKAAKMNPVVAIRST
jgi:ABC-type antimicrobial peptide transport system permease subunit